MHIALLTKDTVLANDLRTALRVCGFGTTVIEREADVQTVVRGQDVLILDMMATGEAQMQSIYWSALGSGSIRWVARLFW